MTAAGEETASALEQLGEYMADIFRMNAEEANFRIVCPDEVASNKLGAVFEATDHAFTWPLDPDVDPGNSWDGRVMEVLSEHNCQGWLQGYVLTGRHGVFPCYEAFIPIVDGMVNQYGKFLKMSRDEAPVARAGAVAQLPADLRRLAPGPQRLLAPGARASSTRCSTASPTSRGSTCHPTATRCSRRWRSASSPRTASTS